MNTRSFLTLAILLLLLAPFTHLSAEIKAPKGFTSLLNGKDLSNWYGWSTKNPEELWKLSTEEQKAYKDESRTDINEHWSIDGDVIVNDGHGLYLTTEKEFSDYELLIDYKTVPKADSGIYLKGVPQVQIWDYTDPDKFGIGGDKGSGGLWNNSKGAKGKDPLVLADNKLGEWNSFRIRQVGARTTVWLNKKLIVDHATLENYFDRSRPLFHHGPIQLQTHGGEISWRNIFVRNIDTEEANRILLENSGSGFTSVFNGKNLDGWAGPIDNYEVVDGAIRCKKGKGGTLFTKDQYGDFVVRLEIKLPPAGNNGLAIRYPGQGNPANDGMCELQVLDNSGYSRKLAPYQYHGSAYGMVPAARGYLRPAGEWNYQEVTVKGSTIKVELNGSIILDTDLSKITDEAKVKQHPGKDLAKGHFGFAGHNDPVMFRNIEIKKLD